jgi:phosphoglycerate dehydrogenase-like enzyme
VTPHLGGATFRSMARTEVFMAEKLRQFLHS